MDRFKKSLLLAPSWRSNSLVLQNVYINLPYIMAAIKRTAGIDKLKKLRHCQSMYTNVSLYLYPHSRSRWSLWQHSCSWPWPWNL